MERKSFTQRMRFLYVYLPIANVRMSDIYEFEIFYHQIIAKLP